MKIEFTDFHPLSDLAQATIRGEFTPGWNGQYLNCARNGKQYKQPNIGSGFSVSSVRLFATQELPDDLKTQIDKAAANNGNGWIYILRSNRYNILYIGISEKLLAAGVFGGGRFRHHLRKLLAAKGGATNHTTGWREHAKERYAELSELAKQSALPDNADVLSDLYIALAHVPTPKDYEKRVLNECKTAMDDPMILNRATNGDLNVVVELHLPRNAPDGEETGDVETFDLEELEQYDLADSGAEDYAEYLSAMPEDCRQAFRTVLSWARNNLPKHDPRISEGVIGYLGEQPEGYSGIPLVGFSRRKINGSAMPHGWFARIPLVCSPDRPMTVILPLGLYPGSHTDDIICRGKGANFRPVDLEDFLTCPEKYIDPAKDENQNQQRTNC